MTRNEAALIAEEVVKRMKAEGLVSDKVIGVEEVAEILGCKVQTVYNKIDELPHCKVGKHVRFFQSEIFKMLRR